ncbi:MAG: spore germination protein [Solirubrobacterales bacterium]
MDLQSTVNMIKQDIGEKSPLVARDFLIGSENFRKCTIFYVGVIADKNIVDRDILKPLMIYAKENFMGREKLPEYLVEKYITTGNVVVEKNIETAVEALKRGKTVVIIENEDGFIVADTTGGEYRAISEPVNEASVRGSREGFVEKLGTNISILRRRIKDNNLVIENITLGKRSQADMALVYIDDIVDKEVLDELKRRLNLINTDNVPLSGFVQQYIEDSTYSIFPQSFSSERPDIIQSNILEGRIGLILEGTPAVFTVPTVFQEFFQAVDDYSQRTIVSNFVRIIRILTVFIIITFPSIYLMFVSFNGELIPIKFIVPIVESRVGIALDPFSEIMVMEIIVEFLREGGLRLPVKIGQTLSVVGGIIIGNAALNARIVSPATLLIVGVVTVATFLIPNYDMALAVRFIRFPMLFITNIYGALGIAAGWFLITVHLCSLKSVGIPYFSIHLSDFKDFIIRAPLWKMNKRPVAIPNSNRFRQSDFRKAFRGNQDE